MISSPLRLALASLLLTPMLVGCNSKDQRAQVAAAQAETQFQQGQYQAALQSIQTALGARDDVSDYWLLAARIYLATQDYANAFSAYQNVYQMDRGNIEALRQLCQLGLNVQQPDLVDSYADQLLLLNPSDPLPTIMKGGAALQRADSAGALRFAEKVLAANPSDLNALILKGQILAFKGEDLAAARLIEPTLGSGGDPTARLELLLRIYKKSGDQRAYERVLRMRAQGKPGDRQAQLDWADWLYQKSRPADGLRVVEQLMKRRAHDTSLSSAIVELWLDAGAHALSPAQILNGKSFSVEMKAAFARYANETGQPDLAIALLKDDRALTTPSPASGDALASLGYALSLRGKQADARKILQDVLQRDAGQPLALLSRARLRLGQGDLPGALADSRKVVADNPLNPTARLLLSTILLRQREDILAENSLREGLRANPEGIRLATQLASILAHSGRQSEAQSVVRDFGRAAPISPRALQLMSQYQVKLQPSPVT